MKLIQANEKEFLDANLEAQFIFGARLVAYPRTDRWDNENNRLQSIKANGDLIPNVYTTAWQPSTSQGDKWVALHIEDFNFNPLPMSELYPSEYLDEQYASYVPEGSEETFSELYGHLSSTEYVIQEIIDTDENITTVTVS